MCILRFLEENTEWSESGDMLAANDPQDDDGGSGVAVLPLNDGGPEGSGDGLAAAEEITSILDCVEGMHDKGQIEDILLIVNLKNDEQLLLTTIDRNDLIIGALEVAKSNWFNTQIALSDYSKEGDEDE